MEVLPIYIESPFLLAPPVSFAKNRDSSADISWGRCGVSKHDFYFYDDTGSGQRTTCTLI